MSYMKSKLWPAALGLFGLMGAAPAFANHDILIIANTQVTVQNVNATIGNMYCNGHDRNSTFVIPAGAQQACSFTHTHGITAVYFQVYTPGTASDQKCAVVVTTGGIHHDPDDVLPGFSCSHTSLTDNTITVN